MDRNRVIVFIFCNVQTSRSSTEIVGRHQDSYQMSEVYAPDYARGVRWDDPAFQIEWPPAQRNYQRAGSRLPFRG